jgi:RNA polymerase primary sigma factor
VTRDDWKRQSLEISPETLASDPLDDATGTLHTADGGEETTSPFEDRASFGPEVPLEDPSEEADDDELTDHVKQYMRQLAKTPLLTGEGEKEIALRIEEARRELEEIGFSLPFAAQKLLHSVSRSKTVSDPEEPIRTKIEQKAGLPTAELKQLLERLKRAKKQYVEARNVFTKANLRLVVAIARKYMNRGLAFPDLVQEGNVGLMKAVEKFDCRMGYRFSTYAAWWIKQAMRRAIEEQTRTIHLPAHMLETVKQVARLSHELTQDLGREPFPHEIAGKMGLSVKKVREVLNIIHEPISLETPVGDGDTHLVDLLEDRNAAGPQDPALFNDLVEGLNKALSSLTAREEKVIRMRFGLGEKSQHTLEQVAQTFGLTRERVRQIEGKALRKLRHHAKALGA